MEINKTSRIAPAQLEGNKVFCNVTVITCKFATRCELIKRHLQSKEVNNVANERT